MPSVYDERKACRGYTSEPESAMKSGESASNFSMQPSAIVPPSSAVSAATATALQFAPCDAQSATPGDAQHIEGEAQPWLVEAIHQDTFESQGEIPAFMPLVCSSPRPDASEGEEAENPTEGDKSERAFIFEHSITGRQEGSRRISKRRRVGRRPSQFSHAHHPVSRSRSREAAQVTLGDGGWEQQKDSFNQVIEFIFFSQENFFYFLKKTKMVEDCEELTGFFSSFCFTPHQNLQMRLRHICRQLVEGVEIYRCLSRKRKRTFEAIDAVGTAAKRFLR